MPLPDLSQVLDLRISCSELGIKCEPISPFLIKQFESSVNEIKGLRLVFFSFYWHIGKSEESGY